MPCPRCKKSYSNQITFNLKPQKIRLVAQCCKVCGFLFADDDEMLKAIRGHLHWVTQESLKGNLNDGPPVKQ